MQKSLLKLLGFVVALGMSASASALGMGGINVMSALGQPLKAEIDLVSLSKAEKASLVARLASSDAYKGAGLEYPYSNKFRFQIENHSDGTPYLKVSSEQPVNDPFVSLLVELQWAAGRLLREYTFLLDPPGYVPTQPAQASVEPVAPAAPMEPAAAAAVQEAPAAEPASGQAAAAEELKQQPETMRAKAPGDEKALSKKATVTQDVGTSTKSDVTVQRGDTLAKIASANKPADVSLERMLVALYRANASQFDGKNMNRIKTGKILRLPDQDQLLSVGQAEAASEIRAQAADWNAYRQKLASAATVSAKPDEAKQTASGKITSSVADKAPVAKESAKEVLKLSKGEAPGDQQAAGGKAASAQDKKNAAQEEAIAKAKAAEDEKARLALLEQNVKDMQRLAELKGAASEAASAAASAPVVAPVSGVAAASEVAAASAPAAKPKRKVVAPPPPPELSLVDQVLQEPLYLGAGAALLLGLGGLGYMVYRRRNATPFVGMSAGKTGDATSKIAVPEESSPETGDFTTMSAEEAPAAPQVEDVDPISEADLFLNFGRDAQAEEVLKDALRTHPEDHRIHLKLLGIYANRVDVKSFGAIALQLKDSGDEAAWQQAAAMGRKLEPNNPLYGGDAHIEDADSATMQTVALSAPVVAAAEGLDFDLGDAGQTTVLAPDAMASLSTAAPEVEETAMPAEALDMDFDVTSTNPSMPAPSMDFDVTSTSPSMPAMAPEEPAEAGLPDLGDLVFDITSSTPIQPVKEEPPASKPDEDGLAFTLDFPIADEPVEVAQPTAPAAPMTPSLELSDISLNLDGIGEPAAAEAGSKDERWHEVATKLDLARAYQEMGDQTGAREILEEVLRDGDEEQRNAAQALIDQLI